MHRLTNNLKTVFLMGGLMGLFVAVGSMYGQQGMIIALVLGGVMNIVSWFFSDKIALAAMRGHEVASDDPGIGGELWHMVDRLRNRPACPCRASTSARTRRPTRLPPGVRRARRRWR